MIIVCKKTVRPVPIRIQLMTTNCGEQDQHQIHWKQLLPRNRSHANANHDHKNHRHVSKANSAAVQTIQQPQPVHSMKDVPYQKHVKKPNMDAVKMEYRLLQAKNTKDVQIHCVRVVCLDVVHPMAKLKQKDPIAKVIIEICAFDVNISKFKSSFFFLVQVAQSSQRQQQLQQLQLQNQQRNNKKVKVLKLGPEIQRRLKQQQRKRDAKPLTVHHVRKNNLVVAQTKLHRLTVQMAKVVALTHHSAAVQTITIQQEDRILKDVIVKTHHTDAVQIIRQLHEAMKMLVVDVNTNSMDVVQTKSLQLQVIIKTVSIAFHQ